MANVQSQWLKQILVIVATIGTIAVNWIASTGRIGGVTPGEISEKYFTTLTPAGYAFSIWALIYTSLIVFSIYQALPANAQKFGNLRSLYIFSCAANCAWVYMWHFEQIWTCLAIILVLWLTLGIISFGLRKTESTAETLFAATPFALYFGWVTAASILNFVIALKYSGIETSTVLACALITLAAALGAIIRPILSNSAYPLAIAWALTAIGVSQSGKTAIVIFTAFGTIACLLAALSFVLKDKSAKI